MGKQSSSKFVHPCKNYKLRTEIFLLKTGPLKNSSSRYLKGHCNFQQSSSITRTISSPHSSSNKGQGTVLREDRACGSSRSSSNSSEQATPRRSRVSSSRQQQQQQQQQLAAPRHSRVSSSQPQAALRRSQQQQPAPRRSQQQPAHVATQTSTQTQLEQMQQQHRQQRRPPSTTLTQPQQQQRPSMGSTSAWHSRKRKFHKHKNCLSLSGGAAAPRK